MNSTTNIKSLRHGVGELMTTLEQTQTCKADVQRLAGQLSQVVYQVNGLQRKLRKPE